MSIDWENVSVSLQWITYFDSKKIALTRCPCFETALLQLFEQHTHEGRVILPLLKTISLLMNRLCIDRLVDDTSFSMAMLNSLEQEESKCKDVHRLTAIIDVSLGLMGTGNGCQKVRLNGRDTPFHHCLCKTYPVAASESQELLAFVCRLLMHPFPRVRRIAAENLYVKLVEQPTMVENHPALELLLSNPWDSTDEATAVKMAAEVASSLEVAQLVDPIEQ